MLREGSHLLQAALRDGRFSASPLHPQSARPPSSLFSPHPSMFSPFQFLPFHVFLVPSTYFYPLSPPMTFPTVLLLPGTPTATAPLPGAKSTLVSHSPLPPSQPRPSCLQHVSDCGTLHKARAAHAHSSAVSRPHGLWSRTPRAWQVLLCWPYSSALLSTVQRASTAIIRRGGWGGECRPQVNSARCPGC